MVKPKKPKPLDIFVSVVVLSDNKTRGLAKEIKALSDLLRRHYSNYEIIVIDNVLRQFEIDNLTTLLDSVPCIRIIQLARNYSRDVCVFVGLESAIGDIVVVRTVHDPLTHLTDFIDKAQKVDMVLGISRRPMRRGIANRYGAKFFYWYNKKFLDISIPENSTYYMAFTRRAVNALTRSGRHARHIRYLARQIGYKTKEYYYFPDKTHVPERKELKELLVSALELATAYSKHPLRSLAWIGFVASLSNLAYAGYVIIVRLVRGHVAEGWTTLSLQAALMFFLLFAILAILCEYIGQILEESRKEAPYHIADELNSKISVADTTRRNISY